jgi:hypothetical protein
MAGPPAGSQFLRLRADIVMRRQVAAAIRFGHVDIPKVLRKIV